MFAISLDLRHDATMTTTRRERLRQETLAEIKLAAIGQIATEGASGLSIRGVARAIGMSPAGLYRYYRGLDDLLTELITDAYDDLAAAVETGIAEHTAPANQLIGGAIAYRRWSVTNPNRFLLIFGTPVPGYAAPEGGSTVAAMRRVGNALFSVVAASFARGGFAHPKLDRVPTAEETDLAAEIAAMAPGFPATAVPWLIDAWAHFHGLVTLEILNQLGWIYPDAERFYTEQVTAIVERMLD